jgi:hypothetical protein
VRTSCVEPLATEQKLYDLFLSKSPVISFEMTDVFFNCTRYESEFSVCQRVYSSVSDEMLLLLKEMRVCSGRDMINVSI